MQAATFWVQTTYAQVWRMGLLYGKARSKPEPGPLAALLMKHKGKLPKFSKNPSSFRHVNKLIILIEM